MSEVKIQVNQKKCVACGACEELAPEVFVVGVTVEIKKDADIENEEIKEKVRLAAEVCPQKVISLKE